MASTPPPAPTPDAAAADAGAAAAGAAVAQRARFRVKFSDVVLAFPPGAQRHPASLKFSFDSFWQAETTATRPPPSDADTHHPLAFTGYSNNSSRSKALDAPEPELRFIYETSLASKLHRKFLVLTLALPPGAHAAPTATAIISIDALARGCQRVALTFPDPADAKAPSIATAHFRVSVLHFERVQARLYDVKVADYPEKHIHDVKLLFIEMGYRPFADGPVNPTEKSSDAEPRFGKLPTLEKVCSLQEMLHGGAAPTDLRVFFSLHRQVARTRTEEIGLGALPVHMLFSKIVNGKMEEPTKFKVPLAGYKGVVKGKIMLRNIPQWSQLGGDDLVNRDGTIIPTTVDLNTRKLLPWMKLPRAIAGARKPGTPSPAVRAYASPPVPPMGMMPSGPSSITAPDHHPGHGLGGTHPPPSAKWPDGGAAPLVLPPHIAPPPSGHVRRPSADYYADVAAAASAPPPSEYGGSAIPLPLTGSRSGGSATVQSSFTDQDAMEREQDLQREYQRQREEYQRNAYYASNHNLPSAPPSAQYLPYVNLGPEPGDEDAAAVPPDASASVSGGKSTKSIGSSTTGYDGGSPPQSSASDDGQVPQPAGDEWAAVLDPGSDRYYFANSATNESLWLPPMWEQRLDGDGRPFFVDHGSQTTQREFPAAESRAYKISVSEGGGP